MQDLEEGLIVTLSPREMDVLYDPLESEGRIRVSLQNEAYTITEYGLPSPSPRCMVLNFFLVLLPFTD